MNLSINFYTIRLITDLNFQVKFLHKPTYSTKILHTDTYMHICIFTYIKEKKWMCSMVFKFVWGRSSLKLPSLRVSLPNENFRMLLSQNLPHCIEMLGQYLICAGTISYLFLFPHYLALMYSFTHLISIYWKTTMCWWDSVLKQLRF